MKGTGVIPNSTVLQIASPIRYCRWVYPKGTGSPLTAKTRMDMSCCGWHALVPSIGAGLVLWSAPSSHLAWLLSNPLASYLGRISYSTYLFHWPLIVLYRVAKGREHLALKEQLGLLAITLLLGALCQRFIENRYRDQPEASNRKFLTWLLICTALLVAIGWAFQQDKVAHARQWASSHITHKQVDLRRNERFKLR